MPIKLTWWKRYFEKLEGRIVTGSRHQNKIVKRYRGN
jgi:hypothetical protein